MKKFILIALFLSISFAQVFDWQGDWKVWDVLPYRSDINKDTCCVPDSVRIDGNSSDQTQIMLSLTFSKADPRCPTLNGNIVIREDIKNGEFFDPKFNGFKAVFRPNNNTIVMYPGIAGNCKWILGGPNSVLTNTTDANRAQNWEGAYSLSAVYPLKTGDKCCIVEYPIIIKQDNSTDTISGLYAAPNDKHCPHEARGRILEFNASIDGGAYDYPEGRAVGWMLKNGTMLEKYWGCVYVSDKMDKSESGIRNSIVKSMRLWLP